MCNVSDRRGLVPMETQGVFHQAPLFAVKSEPQLDIETLSQFICTSVILLKKNILALTPITGCSFYIKH